MVLTEVKFFANLVNRIEALGFRLTVENDEMIVNFSGPKFSSHKYVFQTVEGLISWIEDAEHTDRLTKDTAWGAIFGYASEEDYYSTGS